MCQPEDFHQGGPKMVCLSAPVNPGPMYVSRADKNIWLGINLVFVPPADVLAAALLRDQLLKGSSDHLPLSSVLTLAQRADQITGHTLKEDSVAPFFLDIQKELPPSFGSIPAGHPKQH